jgi:lysophospholipase L1-like esterase
VYPHAPTTAADWPPPRGPRYLEGVNHPPPPSPRWLSWPRLLAGLYLLLAVLCCPPLWQRFDPVPDVASPAGWWITAALALLGLAGLLLPPGWAARVVAIALAPALLLGVELGARGSLRSPTHRGFQEMILSEGNEGKPELSYHPFLQYTGNPELERYNGLGFYGDQPRYTKAPGVRRVVCLGASTTASGYPARLQRLLDEAQPGRWEVISFALEGWTSANSLVNFVLNVRDFEPDWVVVHHGWNDNGILAAGACPRRDYLHAPDLADLVQLPPPSPTEAALRRGSVLWRRLRYNRVPLVHEARTEDLRRRRPETRWSDCEPVDAFWSLRRNLRTIAQLAALDGSGVVFMTQPHALDPRLDPNGLGPALDAANDSVRSVQAELPGVILVDLAAELTGEDELFIDLGHLVPRGIGVKAQRVADALLAAEPEQPQEP